MIDVEKACEIALKISGDTYVCGISENATGYIISSGGEYGVQDISPLHIDKHTGGSEVYFPPDHFDEIDSLKKLEVPAKFRKR